MNKKLKIAAITSISIFTLGSAILSTFSWFVASVKAPAYNLKGSSAGAYFAYGDGSENHPYGISIPRHLYNLAWLQYMGQFADGQYYFELADSVSDTDGLNMNGYVLPPIGTEDNPFVGNFNGNGKIIKNLTVSNDQSAIFSSAKHPDPTQLTYVAPEIVGLFGVVGNLDNAYEGTYETSTNTVYNLGISNVTVQTTSSSALVGIAAGYVDATIANVLVNESEIDVNQANTSAVDATNLTENISDYGVVGFATADHKKSITKLEQDLYDVTFANPAYAEFNASDDGDAQGWGGSINMKTIYNRIVSLRKNKSTDVSSYGNSTVNWKIARTYYNNVESTPATYSNNVGTTNNTNDAYSRYLGTGESGHEFIGNYNIYARAASSGYGSDNNTYGDQQYLYLCGGHYENRTYNTYYDHTGYYITDGTNYLTYTGSLTNTTDSSQASLWTISTGNNKAITTTYNGTTYYLYNNSGTLGIRTSSYASWTVSLSNSKYDIYNGNYHLTCASGTWLLTDSTKSYITDGTNYMTCAYSSNNSGTIGNTTTAGSGTSWSFSTYNGTGTISCTVTRNNRNYTYYLGNNNGTLQATTTSSNWTISSSGGTLTVKSGNYYLTYDGGWKLYNPTAQTPYYYIHDEAGHYMGPTSSDLATSVAIGSAVKFAYSTSNHGYYNQSSTSYYLGYYSDNYAVQLYSDDKAYYRLVQENNTSSLTTNLYGTGYLRAFNKNADTVYSSEKYVKWNNNAWTYANSASEATRIVIDYFDPASTPYVSTLVNPVFTTVINQTDSVTVSGPDSHQTSSDTTKSTNESHMYYTANDTTYLPLNVEKDLNSYVSSANTMNTEISEGHLDPKDSNTGYIISGSNIPSSATSFSGPSYSDIRISRYAITNVSASYNKSANASTTINDLANSSVYTINTSNTEQTMANAISANANLYTRYNDSKTSFFQNSLATSSNGTSYTANAYVYGLHFMDSTISKQSIVNAEKVSVLGNKCDTYQFPVDAIDFNLKQKGIINFFAGTYFTNSNGTSLNNSFFSLHEVLRNDDAVVKGDPKNKEFTSYNTISDIKEIEEIYGNDVGEKTTKYANIYKYKNATGNNMYSVPYRVDGNQNKYVMNKDNTNDNNTAYTYTTMGQTDFDTYCATYGYTLKFKTSQIGKQNSTYTKNRIYYFEFPMNPGEYCLGSVTGGTGAYLLYLDIGANAAKTQRTTVYEHYTEIRKEFEYPMGAAIVPVSNLSANLTNPENLDETNTSNFVITAGNASIGTVKVVRADSESTMTRTGGLLTSAKPTLVGDQMWDSTYLVYNIHAPGDGSGSGANLTDEITSKDTVTEVRRLEYYDYNVNLEDLMITYIIDTSTDGGDTWTRTFYQKYQNGTDTTDVNEMKIYNTNGGTKYSVSDLENPETSTVKTYAGADEDSVNTTLMLHITYQTDDGEVLTTAWVLTLEQLEGNNGFYYTISSTQGSIVLTATLNQGSVTINVVSVGSGKVIKINNTTITGPTTVTITP